MIEPHLWGMGKKPPFYFARHGSMDWKGPGTSWWKVYVDDRSHDLVGPAHRLPEYARLQLIEARKDGRSRKAAEKIDWQRAFSPTDVEPEHPHTESVDWLRQWYPEASDARAYLCELAVPHDESSICAIWESLDGQPAGVDLLTSVYQLLWREDEEAD